MDILKTATEWAKGEIFSSKFFILCGVLFVAASIGVWQLGKTEVAKAFIWPSLVAGLLLMTVGIGLVFAYNWKIDSYVEAEKSGEVAALVKSEIEYTEKTMQTYATTVFKAIPILIAIAALLIIFVDKPIWRAICISAIAMFVVILTIDGTAKSRVEIYKKQLEEAAKNL